MNLSWRQVMRFLILLLSPVIVECIAIAIAYVVDNLPFFDWYWQFQYWYYRVFILCLTMTIVVLFLAWPYRRWVADLPLGHLRNFSSLWLAIGVVVLSLTFYRFGVYYLIPTEHMLAWPQYQSLWVYLALVLFRPVAEEIIFRGMLLNAFKSERPWTLWIGALISALIFAGISLQSPHISSFVQYFIMGILLAIARIRSGGLLLPILLNMEATLIAVIILIS
ncbi:CPBP family intramembrane glutamic endopeptidase [Xenorhabdus bovienii]|uniref:CPBP family intramembrane glutamic endopeptidase n=2 Tax=Xenorhabdus bovienii TaxID=40576 RepID=UPI00237D2088|nr:type II CAAX endopeptidase family protein [Xenorhabdus bovienii]MDE1483073.1 CPBP family intramembrane metalloprotease [Xenorhabdus bovienii]MDE9442149.1 CPBP family intramembrane metalloprotease [Xenorhabdus bovienii]MDE9488133.1 CPBP family intramembrane metalloprotease [Xenorhabdus bovienii]MDE9536838.1 CPBP family intramembrane metalloprotease [Xenorhabdus bovienii]MDE9589861.1 CPBP family intramembrane metalloprotease [Xenorhabdus bovienii]